MEQAISVISLPLSGARGFGQICKDFALHVHDHFIPHARNNYHPHILGHRALALFSALLICAKVCAIAMLAVGPIVPAYSSAITPLNIINLTNVSRESYGLADLRENSMLDVAAQNKANDMLAKGYFAHNTPDGKTPWDFITAAGYNYITAGENLAVNFTEAENVETAWMNSPEHKANILNGTFEDIGVGVSEGQFEGHTAIFVVQEFGSLAAGSEKISLTNAPTAVAPKVAPTPRVVVNQGSPAVRADTTSPTPTAAPTPVQNSAAAATQPLPVPTVSDLSISNSQVSLQGDQLNIEATVSQTAVKVTAYFSDKAIMLSPKGNGLWQGSALPSELAAGDNSVYLRAQDISGKTVDVHLADFSNSVVDNYNLASAGTTPTSYVNFYGAVIDPNNLLQRFYLLFIAIILTCLIIAIAIKRHVQHLPMIANASFTVILACLLMAR